MGALDLAMKACADGMAPNLACGERSPICCHKHIGKDKGDCAPP